MSPELTHLDRAGHDGEPGGVHGGAHVEQHALVADVGETPHRGQPGAHLQRGSLHTGHGRHSYLRVVPGLVAVYDDLSVPPVWILYHI